MALPLPQGHQIHIDYRKREANYEMPSLEVAEDHFSLIYIKSGDRTTITPSEVYTQHAGCVCCLPPFLYHKTIPASKDFYESILIKFAPDFVLDLERELQIPVLDCLYGNRSFEFEPETREKVEKLFLEMYEIYEHAENYVEYRLKLCFYQLLMILIEHAVEENAKGPYQEALSEPILDVVFYIEENYEKNITLEEMAEKSGYSEGYFSRLFSKQLGISFSEYLGNVRLRHVQSLLISTDLSITDIALETGFQYPGNMTSFFKQKIGMTPFTYRKEQRKKKK